MTDERNPILCIYHDSCQDGFSAAWAVWKRFGDQAEYFGGVHGKTPPDVTGKHVIMVDFSYKRPVILEMAKQAASILILDHHKSAKEDLADFQWACPAWEEHMQFAATYADANGLNRVGVKFDMRKSGAVLAWEYFHPGKQIPVMLLHVQDRDLWKFDLFDTKAITAAIFSHPYDFHCWSNLASACENSYSRGKMVDEGVSLLRKQEKDIAELLPLVTRQMLIGGYCVPVANLPYTMASDAGGKLAEGQSFAATYYDGATHRYFSLRSRDGGVDVSEIAKAYGGGGHQASAGFRMPIGWEGDLSEDDKPRGSGDPMDDEEHQINRNPDGTYMNEDQILADLPNRMEDPETLAVIKANFAPPEDADRETKLSFVFMRVDFGMWIRNSYGMWRKDNPHVILNPELNAEAIIDHPQFPDNMSARIIDRFVASLQDEAVS